ncbi:MAG: exonuclease SbcCD subunit D C-terminal domain-containing protein [Cardiobacteriaceae bacterium]|nr:exonuclease SbcCD subunit D C-terminal domain-containing protein [Cardiobacteriaceae bacterium]
MKSFKLLHSADWHLGARLAGQAREAEQRAFLDWLLGVLAEEAPDALVIAGDVFDSATPPVAAQEMYYRFLHAAGAHCRHIVVIGGNHDSAALLDAPRALLAALSVQVVGATHEKEVFALHDGDGAMQAVVAAVPYLRERDVRSQQAGESVDDKARAVATAIAAHYAQAAEKAEALRAGADIPAIATGHLFAAGGASVADDGMRELYVGQLGQVGAEIFADTFDYVALGHLHRAQTVGGRAHIRYSGAPFALGFGESTLPRQILRVTFHGRTPEIAPIAVPVWQTLATLRGTRDALIAQLQALAAKGESVWVEAHLEADTFDSHLHDALQAVVADTPVKLLRLHNAARRAEALRDSGQTLATLTPEQVFAARLAQDESLDDDARAALSARFAEIYHAVQHAH